MRWEGGYSNHPADPGGETYRGISRRAHPNWDGWRLLNHMMPVNGAIYPQLEPLVEKFYRETYWNKIYGERLPDAVAMVVFDHAVHSGVPRASRTLQRKVGAKVDGQIGEMTVAATWEHCARLGADELLGYRKDWLTDLSEKKPSLKVFKKGWLRRIDALYRAVWGERYDSIREG